MYMDMTNIWKQMQEDQDQEKIDDIDTEFEEVDPGKDDPDTPEEEAVEGEVIEDLSEYAEPREEVDDPGVLETKPESEDPIDQLQSDVDDESTYEGIVVGEANGLGGRPSKLDDQTMKRLSQGLKIGLSQKKAAVYAGISETTFYRWRQRAFEIDDACNGNPDLIKNADDLELWEFWESIKKARVEGEISHLAVITDAANNGVWQASAWFLERSNPKEWGKRSAEEIEGSKKKAITFNIKYSS